MDFHTFGDPAAPVMLLLHGMLTPWQIWTQAADCFSKTYHVIVPALDGHTAAPSLFRSVEDEAETIAAYLREAHIGRVDVICGLSMGGRIAAVLAARPDVTVGTLVLDGAPLLPVPRLLQIIMKKNYAVILEKSRARDPKTLAAAQRDFLPERHLPAYLPIADRLTQESVTNMIESVFAPFDFASLKDVPRILFLHGTKGSEAVSRKAAVRLRDAVPQTQIRCFPGYAHAQLACFEEANWIEAVRTFLEQA